MAQEENNEYCCNHKKRLMENNLFLERLSTSPKVLIFTNHTKCQTFKKTFEIKNEDIDTVYVTIKSDFTDGLSFQCEENFQIPPQLTKTITVYYEPTALTLRNESKNFRFNIFLIIQHPQVCLEFPILVCRSKPVLSIPNRIFFRNCALNLITYYSMVVYNPDKKPVLFTTKWTVANSNVRLLTQRQSFEEKSCTKINFTVIPDNECVLLSELLIISGEKYLLTIFYEVTPYHPYIDNQYLTFSRVYYGFSTEESLNVCNESLEPIKIKWCRKELKEHSADDLDPSHDIQNVKHIGENFLIIPKSDRIPPKSSIKFRAIFIPKPNLVADDRTEWKFKSHAYLAFSTDSRIRLPIVLSGCAKGPDIVLNFCSLELGNVVIGEKRCIRVKVMNPSEIPGVVKFIGCDSAFGGIASCFPEFHTLDPQEEKSFLVEYFGTCLGKFVEKIMFQIENGRRIRMTISGTMEPIRVIPIPDVLDFGTVDICSLQKMELRIKNPLSTPVLVSMFIENDGVQEPLIISDFNDFIENYDDEDVASVQNLSVDRFMTCNQPTNIACGFDLAESSSVTSWSTGSDMKIPREEPKIDDEKTSSEISSKSSEFINVLNRSSEVALGLVNEAKFQDISKHAESDLTLLDSITGDLLKMNYFQPLAEIAESQEKTMRLPNVPREYLFSPEPIFIEEFQSKTVPVFLTPNKSGQSSVILTLRVSIPEQRKSFMSQINVESKEMISIPEEAMITPVVLKHNCVIPELKLDSDMYVEVGVDFGKRIPFPITNTVEVPGVITLQLDSIETAEVEVSTKRFVIQPLESVNCEIKITHLIVGTSILRGTVEVFGSNRTYPFKIRCHSGPPEFNVTVTPIKHEQKVLVNGVCMTYILNTGMGLVQYEAKTKNDSYIKCTNPEGFIYPKECKEIALSTYFYDPGVYSNLLFLDIKHLQQTTIKVMVSVHGLPLKFTPRINSGLNLEVIAASPKPLITSILMENLGKKSYKVFLARKKTFDTGDEKSKFDFEQSVVPIGPNTCHELKLILIRTEPSYLKQIFQINGADTETLKRIQGFNFTAEVKINQPKLRWSRQRLEFEFRNSDFYEMSFGEPVSLKNESELTEHVTLETVGSFEIFDLQNATLWTKLSFVLGPLESKDLVICFQVKEVNQWNRDVQYEGKILIKTPDRNHRTLPLMCKIIFPVVTLPRPTVHYYTQSPFLSYFLIENPGEMLAFYHWSHQGTSFKKCSEAKPKNFRTLEEEFGALEIDNLLVHPIDIQKEWLMSFRKFLDSEVGTDENIVESETVLSSDVSNVETAQNLSNQKQDVQNISSRGKSNKIPASKTADVEKIKKRKKSKEDVDIDKTPTPNKSKRLSNKSGKHIVEVNSPKESILKITPPPLPKFTCEQSKLQVGLNDIVKKYREIFAIESNQEPFGLVNSIEDIAEDADSQVDQANLKNVNFFAIDYGRGSIYPKTTKRINLYFDGAMEDLEIDSSYIMDVVGGRSERLNIAVCNTSTKIEISKTNFNAKLQPWYKINHFKVNIKNTNPHSVAVQLMLNEYTHKEERLLSGYIDIRPRKGFLLHPGYTAQFDVAMFIGLNRDFREAFGLEVNGGLPVSVQFRGCGVVPMISILNLERLPFDDISTEQEYVLLNKIFLNQVKNVSCEEPFVTEEDIVELRNSVGIFESEEGEISIEEQSVAIEVESTPSVKTVTDECGTWFRQAPAQIQTPSLCCNDAIMLGINSAHTNNELPPATVSKLTYRKEPADLIEPYKLSINKVMLSSSRTVQMLTSPSRPRYVGPIMQKADPDLSDFCVLDYPKEYPSSMEINYMLETQHFQSEVLNRKFAWKSYRKILQKHVMDEMDMEKYIRKEKKFEQPIRPTSFKIQPLPYCSSSYRLNLGMIPLDTEMSWTLDMLYHGPGKANFSIRSLMIIPGLTISFLEPKFECSEATGDFKFTIYNNILKQKTDSKYQNINTRSSDDIHPVQNSCGECQGTHLGHSHSYDFNQYLVHTRDVTATNRQAINEFYGWWNRPNKELRDPYIHCEFFQERLARTEHKIFQFNIKFTPSSQSYNDPTVFEDFIYVDIHLGPTVPILLQGIISSDYRSASTQTLASEEFRPVTSYF